MKGAITLDHTYAPVSKQVGTIIFGTLTDIYNYFIGRSGTFNALYGNEIICYNQ